MPAEEVLHLEKPVLSDFAFKSPVAVAIRRTGQLGRNKFEGRFKDLPLVMRARGATKKHVLRQLGDGLMTQYLVLKEFEGRPEFHTFQRNMLASIEKVLLPSVA